jgi:hypothetical protein
MIESPGIDALTLDALDDVATVLRHVSAGEPIRVRGPNGEVQLIAAEPIPLCHKVALRPLAKGATVRKYGQPIGTTTVAVPGGGHVHVHNLESARARRPRAQLDG